MIDKAPLRRILAAWGHALAGVLLLVTGLAGGAGEAQATILVSNLGQGTSTTLLESSWDPEGQGFQTGTHSAGYRLTSVQLHIDSFSAPATFWLPW